MASNNENSLYERVGGREAIGAAINAFHDRVAEDDRLNHSFAGVGMETLIRHQTEFFADRRFDEVD